MDNPVQEIIEERLLKLLGLESEFEMSYEEYIRHLREAMAAARMNKSSFSSEEAELITNEWKRVKSKKGRFTIKSKKTKVPNKPSKNNRALNFIRPNTKLLKPVNTNNKKDSSDTNETILSIIISIRKSVDNIYKILSDQNQLISKISDTDRKRLENEKRAKKENKLESVKDALFNTAKKIIAPIEGILDRIKRFILFTLLGRAFKLFMDWTSDPANKKKVEVLGRFIKDWWPALLSAFMLFATPLGGFVRAVIGTIAKLTFQLAKFAIPKIATFVMANPIAATAIGVGAATGIASGVGWMSENKRKEDIAKKQNTPKEDTSILGSIGNALNPGQLGMGGVSALNTGGVVMQDAFNPGQLGTENVSALNTGGTIKHIFTSSKLGTENVSALNTGGTIKHIFTSSKLGTENVSALNTGGSVFSGIVDKNTGTRVSGAGPDTQFLPIKGGDAVSGGAVLQPGEIVLNKDQQNKMYKDTGIHPASYVAGVKPKKLSSGLFAASHGGILGFNQGGMIGGMNNPNFWITTAIAGKEAGHLPQGQADVAQSIYNRQKMGIYPGGKDIRKIITAPGQYQPTFSNPGVWNAIKDKNSAIKAVGDSKLIDMASKSILNQSLIKNAANFVGSRPDFQGESQKKYMKPDKGDITRGKRHNFFGWFTKNGYNSKMSSPAPSPFNTHNPNQNQVTPSEKKQDKKSQPNIMDRISQFVTSTLYPKTQNKKDGGVIRSTISSPKIQIEDLHEMRANSLERQGRFAESYGLRSFSSGKIIKGTDGLYNPHSSSDPRMFPIMDFKGIAALQVGEGVVPRNVMNKMGEDNFNKFIAYFDTSRTSNASRIGYNKPKINVPEPPARKNYNSKSPIMLPAIQQSSSDISSEKGSNSASIPQFSVVSPSSYDTRNNLINIYGIVG